MNHQPLWGYITQKGSSINLIVFRRPKSEIILYGLRNKTENAYLLSDKKIKFDFYQEHKKDHDYRPATIIFTH
jgi:hypothetical protein